MPTVPKNMFIFLVCTLAIGLAVTGVVTATDSTATESTSQTTIYPNENTSNYLSSPPVEISEAYDTVDIDVSSAVDSSAQDLHVDHEMQSFQYELSSAEFDQRATIAQDKLEAIEQRYHFIDTKQEELYGEYRYGSTESTELLRELTRLQSAAASQEELRQFVEQQSNPDSSLLTRLHSIEHALVVQQPVIESIQRTLMGEEDAMTVSIRSGNDAIILSTIDDQQFKREATLRGERNLDGDDQFVVGDQDEDELQWGMPNAFHRANELYPWTFDRENLIQHDMGREESSIHSQIYKITATHVHGELSVYLDGATTNVFHESQQRPLVSQPSTGTVRNSTDALSVQLEMKGTVGPMEVLVGDDQGNAISDASVAVDGQEIGSTDDDGSAWVVRPHDQFVLTVTAPDGETITISAP